MAKPKGKKKSENKGEQTKVRRRTKEGRCTTAPRLEIPSEQEIKMRAKDFDWMGKMISRMKPAKGDDEAMRMLALIDNYRQHPRRPKYEI